MNRVQNYILERKYREPIFRRIVIVVFAFAAMLTFSSVLAGHMMDVRLVDQAEAVVFQATANIEADFRGAMASMDAHPDAIRELRNHVAAMRFSSDSAGSYGFLMNRELVILAHPEQAAEGADMHDAPIDSAEFDEVLKQLDGGLEVGEDLLRYDMQDYQGNPMVAFSAKLSNGWILTLLVPSLEYNSDKVVIQVGLFVLGTVLATVLSVMLARLHKRTLERDIQMGRLEELNQRLEDALVEAQIANKAKSSFLANMSHEIRTPMNAILGVAEILAQDKTLPGEIMEGLAKISNSGGLLLGIINDVLDFSKIEAGKLDINPVPYGVASLINDSVHLNMMRVGSKPIEFTLDIDEDIPSKLIGDELRIKQILNNLLSNAFKYTDSGKVTLSVRCAATQDDGVALALGVRDTGHGMTQKQIDKLFDEYSRFQTGSARAIEGTGLGMAITQRLVYLMNGSIHMESEPEKGSFFVVTLPQGVADAAKLGAELAASLRSFRMSLTSGRERTALAREPMPYGKVLVVDDVETNIYVAQGLLRLYGLQIDTASGGAEAIEKIKAGNAYDIVFMDHMMPGMDGMEATKILRDMGYAKPIVALTANTVAKQAEVFLRNGFDDFISKPIDIRQLDSILVKLVRDKHPPKVVAQARRAKDALPAARDGGAESAERDSARALFASFARDAKKAVEALRELPHEASADDAWRGFTVTVHGMKSALANIGEAELSAAAKALEAAGGQRDAETVRRDAPGLLRGLRALLENASPGEDSADEDIAHLREGLTALAAMCEDYDRKGASDILSALTARPCSPQTRATLDRIMEAVLHSDFEEAGELAANYASGLPEREPELSIAGLDVARGLEKFGGDRETYYRILRSYAASLKRVTDGAEAVTPKNIADYKIAVHGIKGASRDIFALALGESAAGLEEAAKRGDIAYIQKHDGAFRTAGRKLAGDIAKVLEGIESRIAKPRKDRPDTDALLRLRDACEVYDMDGADAAIAEICAYTYDDDGGLAQRLREKADVAEFQAIVEMLSFVP